MKREINFRPAFDKRNDDPNKNYGIHGVDMTWFLSGELGAVQFQVYTNWHLPHVTEELDRKTDARFPHLSCHPTPADLGYHSPKPMYEGQSPMSEHCSLLNGPCYYDGSGLAAQDVFNLLVEQGGDAVWTKLENYYSQTFGELK